MIITVLITVLVLILGALSSVLPTTATLPFGLDSLLITAVSYFNMIMITVPYLQVVWDCFIYLLIFEGVLQLIKLFLGSRTPVSDI